MQYEIGRQKGGFWAAVGSLPGELWGETAACSAGLRAEHAGDHGDLASMPDGMLHDSFEHNFVGIVAAGNLLGQILGGKIAKPLFEEIAALIPAGEEFVPEDGRLGPLLFGIPTWKRGGFGGAAHPFVPEEQMLEQRGNGMHAGNRRCSGELRRDLC